MTSGSSSTTRSKPSVGHAPPSVTTLRPPARRTSSSAKLPGPATTIGPQAGDEEDARVRRARGRLLDRRFARVEQAGDLARLRDVSRCARPGRGCMRVDRCQRLDRPGNHVAMPCARSVSRSGADHWPAGPTTRSGPSWRMASMSGSRPPTAGSFERLRRPVAVPRSPDERGRPRRWRRAPPWSRGPATRCDGPRSSGPPRGSSNRRCPHRWPARRPAPPTSSTDEPVLVQLLDERGARDAEASRGLALVVSGRLERLGDERPLERLDARAQRVARAGIARRSTPVPTEDVAAPRRATARGRA